MDNTNYFWEKAGIADETSLVQQLYDVYGREKNNGELVLLKGYSAEEYVRKTPSICGFRNEETLKRFQTHKVIFITYEYFDKVMGTNIYKVEIDWEALMKYASFLHDKEADIPLGEYKQKRLLKEIIESVFEKHKETKGTITEKVLGEYLDHEPTAHVIKGDDAPDRKIQFITTLRLLEKEGFLKILDIEFDFNAVPEFSERNQPDWSLSMDNEAYFYPAQHCAVTLSLTNQKVHNESKTVNEEIIEQSKIEETWSTNFKWTSETEFSLGNNNSIKFGNPTSDRIKLFKELTNVHGDWAEVKKMAGIIGKSETQVRVIIGQLNKENLGGTIIEIESRNDKSKPGAYRIITNSTVKVP